jgi:hypothetical protein
MGMRALGDRGSIARAACTLAALAYAYARGKLALPRHSHKGTARGIKQRGIS